MYAKVVVKQLVAQSNCTQFLPVSNQRKLDRQLKLESLQELQNVTICANGHRHGLLVSFVGKCATNVMLSNLCKQRNDVERVAKEEKLLKKEGSYLC